MSFVFVKTVIRQKFAVSSTVSHCRMRVHCRTLLNDCLNAFIYNSEGATKMKKISIDGMNEIKYALRYNHKFSDIFTLSGSNEMIRRGIDKTSKIIGLMISCLCSLNCSRTCSLKVLAVCATDRCRATPKMMNKAEDKLARNGATRWKKRIAVL